MARTQRRRPPAGRSGERTR